MTFASHQKTARHAEKSPWELLHNILLQPYNPGSQNSRLCVAAGAQFAGMGLSGSSRRMSGHLSPQQAAALQRRAQRGNGGRNGGRGGGGDYGAPAGGVGSFDPSSTSGYGFASGAYGAGYPMPPATGAFGMVPADPQQQYGGGAGGAGFYGAPGVGGAGGYT